MLDLRGLTIKAGARDLVRDLSLHLPDSGITALIGPSGCGKTSVLKYLAGILSPALTATGTAAIDDAPIDPPHGSVAYQPQSDTLFPWLTVAQNAALGLEVEGMPRATAARHVAALMPAFGLQGTERMFPSELSGGMRQRATFLRTIVQDSRFVLLDEPFSALDAVTRLRMQTWLLERLRERPRGVLLITHDLHEATVLADRILVMAANPGRIIADLPVPVPHAQRNEAAMADLRETLKTLLLKD
ncbi:MAG: ABC transporter ATP-binding protein [Paracoccus denitrificans]|nr:MAG: ABC transporter ATP-binding protein [Paracoccus denitrificans]PZO86350.1 MAG: ABC transporter ATP-binding protein [Paracoccus denitrificans]